MHRLAAQTYQRIISGIHSNNANQTQSERGKASIFNFKNCLRFYYLRNYIIAHDKQVSYHMLVFQF